MFILPDKNSVRKVLSVLLFSLFTCVATANDKTPAVIFQQAINDDLTGYHSDARQKYDVLKGTEISKDIAVPSAVNLAALGRYGEAQRAFNLLQQDGNRREQDYAHLWDLWLTARTYQGGGGKAALQRKLTDKVANYKWSSAYESAIADIYAGKSSAKEIFQLIDGITFNRVEEKADAVTQTVFFMGGYYQYVINQPQQAMELYQRYVSHLNNDSLERSLIQKELLFLSTPK
ncbi:hypothetical protein [Pragia fontium]|uniref:Tetratricopeptide repeat protein n=2 Tax=Pragia fontium TaxID=82985 RepID=A0AAJ4WCF9_9GAMM|nr:hypothetical protein [Pragia fontium]GKX64407.1 hypothetical protein SOASR032_29760 [Pragia fontium]SFD18852.1 hypothetical protein SAMN02745723_109119 [Pragia fontium DSM 5563 = ATCC 49100]SUB81065.1 Uncharacterised protein [Pragia fontium]VEJ52974.1 Uncharacterised protein [Pragia fontium]